ncbi:MAG: hypothetical protein LBS19_13285 [Clostridiales bacterium]|jgi:hypothetical protein|nr:hypothetical protein [Clostridiales bacterium]
MKIAESAVQMQGTSQRSTSRTERRSDIRLIATGDMLAKLGISVGQHKSLSEEMLIDLSDAAKKAKGEADKGAETGEEAAMTAEELIKQMQEESEKALKEQQRAAYQGITNMSRTSGASAYANVMRVGDYKTELLMKMLKLITGRDMDMKEFTFRNDGAAAARGQSRKQMMSELGGSGAPVVIGGELRFKSVSIELHHKESVSFNASASVKTEDGREINVELGLNMSRELSVKLEMVDMSVGILKDPLVINFDAASAELAGQKIQFDLDCDGESDQISALAKGSGFLALDKNGDGAINDGNELFGVHSGDGFADLARYDGDGNGWIDENDAVWDKLRVWTTGENGEQKLLALGEVGIGAVYLGNVKTDYNLNGESGDTNGVLRKTGFFLKEDGTGAGTVQHVDLVV